MPRNTQTEIKNYENMPDLEEIKKMLDKKWKVTSIAKYYDVTAQSLYHIIKKHGLKSEKAMN